MKLKYILAAFAALTIAARADFTTVADLAANDAQYIASAEANNVAEKAAILVYHISTDDGLPISAAAWATLTARADVQEVLAQASQHLVANPVFVTNSNYEGVVRTWLKTTEGVAWAAANADQVAAFLSTSPYQHLLVFNDYNTPATYNAWKAAGFTRPLGEVIRPESIAFIAGMHGDWPTITAMDRSAFTYDVFSYPLYAKWAKAASAGNSIQENYAFVQQELVNVGLAASPGSIPILEHLNKLSTLMFTMMRQGEALQP